MPHAPQTRRAREAFGGRLGGFIYGTVLVLSVVVAEAAAFPDGPGHVALLVGVTTLVFWLAHVYAHGIAFSIGHDTRLSLAELRTLARREAAILEAGVPIEAALLLAVVGVLSEQTAVWLALGLGMAALTITAVVFARVEHLGPLKLLAAIVANLAFGVTLIVLKVLVAH